MTRILFAAAVAMAVAAADARADWGWGQGAAPAQAAPGQAAAPAQAGGDCYGWHPALRRCMWWKKDCKGGHCGGAAAGPAGTLVFPQHQFARTPRDWFMTGY